MNILECKNLPDPECLRGKRGALYNSKMKYTLLILVLLSLPALACKLPPHSKLVIGCTYECSSAYKLRLHLSALALGYNLEVINLREKTELSQIDGVLIPGGADIDPDYYSDKVTPELETYLKENRHLAKLGDEGKYRDHYEYNFLRSYLENKENAQLPLLGICRGMQMMTVAQGIPLFLDIKTELGIKNRRYLFDRVHLAKNTKLDEIYKNDSLWGFKLHHQGLRVPYYREHALEYPDVKVTAWSHDGKIAEGIEYQSRPAIGVQYHPEKSFTNTAAPIFRWLLTRSCEYKNSRVNP